MRYKQKSVVVDAVQFNGQNVLEIKRFIGDKKIRFNGRMLTVVPDNLSLETTDWLVKYSDTQFVVFKDSVFDGFFNDSSESLQKKSHKAYVPSTPTQSEEQEE